MSAECSTAEAPPFHGNNPEYLRACLRRLFFGPTGVVTKHKLVVDGRTVPVTLVRTPVTHVNLPPNNMLGVPAQHALSDSMGWVALLPPMTPGVHHVAVTFDITLQGTPLSETNQITIKVKRDLDHPKSRS
jgi:hypothetical protein